MITGATPEQIEAGFQRLCALHSHWDDKGRYAWRVSFERDTNHVLPYIVPSDHRIIGPDEVGIPRSLVDALDEWRTQVVADDGNLVDAYDAWKAGNA